MSDNLETRSLEVDIEKIIGEIRREIQEKGYKETDLSFSDIPIPENHQPQPAQPPRSVQVASVAQGRMSNELKDILGYLTANYEHDIMLPFNSMNPIAAVIKKIVRKMVRFLFYPVLARQNALNSSMVNALSILAAECETKSEAERTIAELQEKVNVLEEELNRLKMQEVRK